MIDDLGSRTHLLCEGHGNDTETNQRRQLLGGAATVAAFTIVPRHVLGQGQTPPERETEHRQPSGRAARPPPTSTTCPATAARGWSPCATSISGRSVATRRSSRSSPRPRCTRTIRKMLDEMGDKIDAVIVGTPDHTHAVAAMAAIKRGKHVYCEKPLAHSVAEVRALMKAAQEYKVVTQLGNQGHSFDIDPHVLRMDLGRRHRQRAHDPLRLRGRQLGSRHAAAAERERGRPGRSRLGPLARSGPGAAVPFLLPAGLRGEAGSRSATARSATGSATSSTRSSGPSISAPRRRSRRRSRTTIPRPRATLSRRATSSRSSSRPRAAAGRSRSSGTAAPRRFPAPKELEPERKPVEHRGAMSTATRASIMYGSHGAGGVRIIPEAGDAGLQAARAEDSPRQESASTTRTGCGRSARAARPGSDFSYGGPLTELAMLGVIALKMPGTKLAWDAAATRFTNSDEANQHVNPPYRRAGACDRRLTIDDGPASAQETAGHVRLIRHKEHTCPFSMGSTALIHLFDPSSNGGPSAARLKD